jgi:hypothetical protein
LTEQNVNFRVHPELVALREFVADAAVKAGTNERPIFVA